MHSGHIVRYRILKEENMRKITNESVQAFFDGKDYKKDNTRTKWNDGNFHHFYLHEKLIASRMDNHDGVMFNTLDRSEHHSRTTCERLNGIIKYMTKQRGTNLGRFRLKNGRIHYVVNNKWIEHNGLMWIQY